MAPDSCRSATPAGTSRYSKRFSSTLPSRHFRPLQGWTVSSIGFGTYLGDHEDVATAKTPPASFKQFMKLFNHSSKGGG